jgi:hypothetical protein
VSIVERITSTADRIAGTGSHWQYGRVNALRAACYPGPTNLRLGTVSASSIQLLWNEDIPNESRFEVLFEPKGALTWSNTVVLPAGATTWTHMGLTPGTGFDYRVRACDANGCSNFSNYLTGYAGGGVVLNVSTTGKGTVTSTPAGIRCGTSASDCSETYFLGTSVSLRADGYVNANTGEEWILDHWTGACSGAGRSCTLTMSTAAPLPPSSAASPSAVRSHPEPSPMRFAAANAGRAWSAEEPLAAATFVPWRPHCALLLNS